MTLKKHHHRHYYFYLFNRGHCGINSFVLGALPDLHRKSGNVFLQTQLHPFVNSKRLRTYHCSLDDELVEVGAIMKVTFFDDLYLVSILGSEWVEALSSYYYLLSKPSLKSI